MANDNPRNVVSAGRTHARRILASALLLSLVACESLEGERVLVAGAHISMFVPANWEATSAPANDDGVYLELVPRMLRSVKLKVLVDARRGLSLDALSTQALNEAAQLEKKGEIKIIDVTQIPVKRGHLAGIRLVHQFTTGPKKSLALTQLLELIAVDSLGIELLALGPKEDLERVIVELDRILGSVKALTPEPETPRAYPPDAVTAASQKATQRLLQ